MCRRAAPWKRSGSSAHLRSTNLRCPYGLFQWILWLLASQYALFIAAPTRSTSASPHTGLMSALLLYLKRVDFVVGGCGTGQGYLNAVMQYPGVFCGHILNALDAWLFTQINGGNCISLALNQGYGWAADINLRFIFDRIFSAESGSGYPAHRREPQQEARLELERISSLTHRSFA